MQGTIDGMNIKIEFRYLVPAQPSGAMGKMGELLVFSRLTECTVTVTNEDASVVEAHKDYSYCLIGDQFVKSIGRKIALTRAIKSLHREERRRIWELYWSKVKH